MKLNMLTVVAVILAIAAFSLVLKNTLSASAGKQATVVADTIIRADRSGFVSYPDAIQAEGAAILGLELLGPEEYDLSKIELYADEGQMEGRQVDGMLVYERIRKIGLVYSCLGFTDALEIQKKGVAVFRKLFGNKVLVCWKSVVWTTDGTFVVPCVGEEGGEVIVFWQSLDDYWNNKFVAGCFPQEYSIFYNR